MFTVNCEKKQVVNLDLSEKMEKLNFPKKSLFQWKDYDGLEMTIELSSENNKIGKNIPAYTVAELSEMFPDDFSFTVQFGCWNAGVCRVASVELPEIFYADNITNALACILIYLKENKHI